MYESHKNLHAQEINPQNIVRNDSHDNPHTGFSLSVDISDISHGSLYHQVCLPFASDKNIEITSMDDGLMFADLLPAPSIAPLYLSYANYTKK